jgi:hypothetical protein
MVERYVPSKAVHWRKVVPSIVQRTASLWVEVMVPFGGRAGEDPGDEDVEGLAEGRGA